jgi:alpha-methylacyl-CoA racemase
MTASLSGIHVVSTAVNVPGPVAVGMLRDMGATVVKIEPPAGDPLSALAPGWYAALSTGVEVLRLDLKAAEGREAVHDRLVNADVLVTSSRIASLERLGLSPADLRERHAALCHVAIVGHQAPRQHVPGHDLTYQASAGLLTPPALPRTLIADLAGAQRAAMMALCLLFARERSRRGGYAEVALAECAELFAQPLRHGLTTSAGVLGGGDPAYAILPARDGWVAVAALEPHFRAGLTRELGVGISDAAALERVLGERTASEWERWAGARGLPLAAVAPVDGLLIP